MANKKINQLVAKTTILSTDLFPLGDGTTGQLFKKTIAELQAAIGGAVISVNGLVGTVVLDTDDIQELASPTNRYFTEARARAAISLTTTGSSGASTYSSSTGVLNVPTYTLAGLGGISASFLSGGTGITYNSGTGVISYSGTVYTDTSVRALVSAGAGLSYNSSTGVFSYSGTVYTDASIRALISLTTNGSSGASTYNNTTGVLNVPTYTLAGLGGISLTSLSGTAPITYNSSTGAIGITQATTSTDGYLSATDWNTFNGKQSALTLGNVSEVVSNVLMFPDGGTNKTIGNLTIQVVQAGSTTNGFLSTTDWNTFNNKQNTITLTTTGTSGNATFSSNTLNIPNYGTALSGYLPLTGGTLTGALGGTSASFSSTITATNSSVGFAINATSAYTSSAANNPIITFGRSGSAVAGAIGYDDNLGSLYIGTTTNHNFLIKTNNSTRVTVTSAGNVGIGTTSPAAAIHINGAALPMVVASTSATELYCEYRYNTTSVLGYIGNGAGIVLSGGSSTDFGIRAQNNLVFTSGGGTERMRITSAGAVYINRALFDSDFLSNETSKVGISFSGGYGQINAWGANTSTYGGIKFQLSLSNGGTFNSVILAPSGNILMGTSTDNGERLYVSGSIRATGSITANSDVRLKKNIERIENALQKVSEISGYTYNTIYDEDRHAGVIAQEIDKVLPEIVNKGNDGLMGVEYGNISALLIEAIKDLKVQNDSLQARLSALEK